MSERRDIRLLTDGSPARHSFGMPTVIRIVTMPLEDFEPIETFRAANLLPLKASVL